MKPLVMIPGIQGRWEWMQPAIDALSREWQIIPCALPGEPGAEGTADGTFDSFVANLDGVLDRAGVQTAVICGVSFGGLIALRYAARRPDRVLALILVSTPGPHWRPNRRLVRYMQWPTLASPLFFAGSLRRFWPELCATYPDFRARLRFCVRTLSRVLAAPAIPSRMSHRARLVLDEDFEQDCARVTSRTLVVTGERDLDRVVSCDDTMAYLSRIHGARARLIERTGHLGIVSAPDRFADIVSEFARTL